MAARTPWRFGARSGSADTPARAGRCTASLPSAGRSRPGRAVSPDTRRWPCRSDLRREPRCRPRGNARGSSSSRARLWTLPRPPWWRASSRTKTPRPSPIWHVASRPSSAPRVQARRRPGGGQGSGWRRGLRRLDHASESLRRSRHRDVRLGTEWRRRRSQGCPDPALEQRPSRRPDQPAQAHQAPKLRASGPRSPPAADGPRCVIHAK